jgi:hypothetical protein
VLLCEVAASVAVEADAAAQVELRKEAAEAHERRAAFLRARGWTKEALADRLRALDLNAKSAEGPERGGDKGPTTTRQSNQAPQGTIRLVNDWDAGVTVDVDGLRYTVAPGRQETITRQAGSFTYRIVGVSTPVTRDLPAGWVHTIRVHPTPQR